MGIRNRRGDVYSRDCPSRSVLDHLFSRWGGLVMISLRERTYRFRELSRRVGGVSEKMLAQTLRTLEKDGFVLRTAQPTVPPRVDYSLTERGREVSERLLPLMAWISENADDILAGS